MKYKYTEDDALLHGRPGGEIIIDLKETASSYIFKVLEFSLHYPIGDIEKLKDGFRINKHKPSIHSVRFYKDDFVLYPYKDGVPFIFRAINDKEN